MIRASLRDTARCIHAESLIYRSRVAGERMSFLNEINAERQMTQRRVPALWMVALMLLMSISSSVAYAGVGESELEMEAPGSVGERTPIQTTDQNWRGNHANEGRGSMPGRMPHPALLDPQYGDPAVMYGKASGGMKLRRRISAGSKSNSSARRSISRSIR